MTSWSYGWRLCNLEYTKKSTKKMVILALELLLWLCACNGYLCAHPAYPLNTVNTLLIKRTHSYWFKEFLYYTTHNKDFEMRRGLYHTHTQRQQLTCFILRWYFFEKKDLVMKGLHSVQHIFAVEILLSSYLQCITIVYILSQSSIYVIHICI